MYSCYLHGWASLNSPCPSCVTYSTTSGNSAVIDPIGPYNVAAHYNVASEGIYVYSSKQYRWIREENYQRLVQKFELAKATLKRCCITDCETSIEMEDRESLENICRFIDDLCRSSLDRFDELDEEIK